MLEKFCFWGERLGLTGCSSVSFNKRCQLKGKERREGIFFSFLPTIYALQFLEGTHYWGPISSEGSQAEGKQPKNPDVALGTQPFPTPRVLKVEIICHPWNQGHSKWPVSGQSPRWNSRGLITHLTKPWAWGYTCSFSSLYPRRHRHWSWEQWIVLSTQCPCLVLTAVLSLMSMWSEHIQQTKEVWAR